jgi:hypothetical protein
LRSPAPPGFDTPTTGFGGAGATAKNAGAIFNAIPVNTPTGFTNTLQGGDDLVATGAAAGDSTLNYQAATAAPGLNPALAIGVTMTGVSAAIVTNNSATLAGFSGAITGLTGATVGAVSTNGVELGTGAAGLNTALTNVTVNANQPFTAFMTAAALAAAPTATITLGGVDPTTVALDVTTGTTGYAALNINSGGAIANDLILGTNATNTATITVAAASTEALTISGTAVASALNIDNLHTFNGSGAVAAVGLNVTFTNPDGLGHVAATGGAGVDTFNFAATAAGTAGFTTLSTVNGGTGTTNTLGIGADTGAIFLSGVAAQITNIQTIDHIGPQTAALTADLSQAPASVTTFGLDGAYTNTVTVSNIINAMTVEYSGTPAAAADVILTHAAPGAGQFIDFTMAQTLPAGPGGTLDLLHLTVAAQVPALLAVNLDSTGNATLNEINNVSDIANNITVTGATALQLGTVVGLASAPQADAYHFATGAINAGGMTGTTGGVTALLAPTPGTAAGMTFTAGPGTNFANLVDFGGAANGEGGAVINFATGTDTVQFNHANPVPGGLLNDTAHNYNTVTSFSTTNGTVNISASGIPAFYTDTGLAVAAGNAVAAINFTGSNINLSLPDSHFNYINFTNTTQNFTGDTVAGAFASAIGGSTITVAAAHPYLLSFYDAATHQAVLETVQSTGGGLIDAA